MRHSHLRAAPGRCARVLGAVLVGTLLTGCSTVNSLRQAPLDEGIRARYHADASEVTELLPTVFESTDLDIALDERGGEPAVVIGERGMSLLDMGFLVRMVVLDADSAAEVRVKSAKRMRTNMMARHQAAALDLVVSLDRAVGPDRIAPFEGMWVRGSRADGEVMEGALELDGQGGYRIDDSTSLTMLDNLEVRRGSTGRGMIGAVLGALGGAFVGSSVADDSAPTIGEGIENQLDALFVGAVVGGIVGKVLGDLIRSERWSPMARD